MSTCDTFLLNSLLLAAGVIFGAIGVPLVVLLIVSKIRVIGK